MTTERLTQAQLEAIRKRAVTSLGGSWYTELIETREDVTLLLAEVERLQAGLEEITIMGRSLRKESNAVILLGRMVDKAREAVRNDNE